MTKDMNLHLVTLTQPQDISQTRFTINDWRLISIYLKMVNTLIKQKIINPLANFGKVAEVLGGAGSEMETITVMVNKIKYKSGYKYQLAESYIIRVGIQIPDIIISYYLSVSTKGNLMIKKGYCWDGPSGPTVDTKNFMRGSLVHDALYQLMREGLLDQKWREQADKELKRICIEDGMSKIRAWWVYQAVRTFAKRCTDAENKKDVLTAP